MDKLTNIHTFMDSGLLTSSKTIETNMLFLLILTYQISPVHLYLSGYYFDNGIQTLKNNKNLLDWQQQEKQISKELLTMLGLKHKPRVIPGAKNHRSAPKFMMALYNELQYDDENWKDSMKNLDLIHYNVSDVAGMRAGTGDADLIMSFENQASEEKNLPNLLFDFSEVPATESVTRAELRLYKYPVKTTRQQEKYNIVINRDIVHSEYSNSSKQLVSSSTISTDYHGWFDIDITQTVTEWLTIPYANNGLYMTVTNQKGEIVPPESIGLVSRRGPDELQTFLVAFFQAPGAVHVRQRRSVQRADRKMKKSKNLNSKTNFPPGGNEYPTFDKCHKEALYIRFSDLQWQDWIIAPEGYAAFHCTGKCTFPLNSYMNATNHAIVQTLVSLMEPYKVPLPCCTPEKMTAISVLYFDDKSNVILKKYKNMVVKTCGCH